MVVASIDCNDLYSVWQEKKKATEEVRPMAHSYPAVVLKPYVERSDEF